MKTAGYPEIESIDLPKFGVETAPGIREYYPDITEPDTRHSRGVTHTDGVITEDGQSYAVLRAVPHNPITEASIAMTTAWYTSIRGHNRHTLEHFMRLGFPGILVGAEGSYRKDQPLVDTDFLGALGSISLEASASNFHYVLNYLGQESGESELSTSDIILLGESRGAMVGMGIQDQAPDNGTNIIYSDLTAPCFPDRLSVADIPRFLRQAFGERKQILRLFGNIALRNLAHYPPTIDPHPKAILLNAAIGLALFSGQAGEMAKGIHTDQNMHITVFAEDLISNPKRWAEIFEMYQGVRLKQIDGAHLTIAHPRTMSHIESRLINLALEMQAQGSMNPKNLDFSRVHLGDGDKISLN